MKILKIILVICAVGVAVFGISFIAECRKLSDIEHITFRDSGGMRSDSGAVYIISSDGSLTKYKGTGERATYRQLSSRAWNRIVNSMRFAFFTRLPEEFPSSAMDVSTYQIEVKTGSSVWCVSGNEFYFPPSLEYTRFLSVLRVMQQILH